MSLQNKYFFFTVTVVPIQLPSNTKQKIKVNGTLLVRRKHILSDFIYIFFWFLILLH